MDPRNKTRPAPVEAERPISPAMIKAWRERMGFSQDDAALALGCSRRTLTGYETGQHQAPRYIGLAMAALAMGMKPYFESAASSAGGEE